MMNLSIHQVAKIELRVSFPDNSNSRTIAISYGDPSDPQKFELTVYGNTEVFDLLPKSDDFRAASMEAFTGGEEIEF